MDGWIEEQIDRDKENRVIKCLFRSLVVVIGLFKMAVHCFFKSMSLDNKTGEDAEDVVLGCGNPCVC
jgi:hypothetical protein